MKTLIIGSHVNYGISRIQKAWIQEIKKHPDLNLHILNETYPNLQIDSKREQRLLLDHDRIFFMFPFIWYGAPSILVKWQEEVLTWNFAYGSQTLLAGKQFGLIISTGGPAEAYQRDGYNYFQMEELLTPFRATSNLCKMQWIEPFLLQGTNRVDDATLQQNAQKLISHIQGKN